MQRANRDRSGKRAKTHLITKSARLARGLGKGGCWVALPVLAAAIWASPASGQSLTWDASGTGTPTDGLGNWDTTSAANWFNGTPPDAVWTNGDLAIFGVGSGTAGTVTINDPSGVSASGLTFNASTGDYTIAASGSDSLTLTGAAAINVASGQSPTISAPIAGSTGLALTGPGTLNLAGANTFSGPVSVNSGSLTLLTGGTLGATTNAVNLGTAGAAATGALTLSAGVNATIGSFASASNGTATNTLSIANGASLNITSNLPATGLNAVFLLGNQTAAQVTTTTNVTVAGAGTLNVSGGANNSSFVVGVGNSVTNPAPHITPTLDMSGLSNFNFTTGLGAAPTGAGPGGNEFAVGVGTEVIATVNLAVNSSITAGTIDVGDSSFVTPGSSSTVPGNTTGTASSNINLGSGINTFSVNNLMVGGGKSTGNIQWSTATTSGSLTFTGGLGGTTTGNIIVGTVSSVGSDAASQSNLTLNGHTVTIQGANVTAGELLSGACGTKSGGVISFDTGTFNAANLQIALIPSTTTATIAAGKSLNSEFDVGSGPSSTGVLNVTSSLAIASNNSSIGPAVGLFKVKGGTANIGANIIDNSSGSGVSTTTVSLTGGTLNMEGFAIGPKTATGNTGAVGTRNITSVAFPTGTGTLDNLGGTGVNDAGLNMTGTGTLILDGTNNTYINGTVITTGTLQVGATGDSMAPVAPFLASGQTITNNSALSFGSSQPVTMAGIISGGNLIQTGTGTTTLTSASNAILTTNIKHGTLQIGNGGIVGSIGTGPITDNGILAIAHSDNVNFTNTISGNGAVQQLGTGTLVLSANNSYTAGTTISNGGTVQVTSPTALGFGGINAASPGATTINSASTLDLAGQIITQSIVLNGGTLTNSSVTASTVTSGVVGVGVSASTPPFTPDAAVSFSGPGTGAAATAVLGLSLGSFTITNVGAGYTGATAAVTITGGGGTGATGVATVAQTGPNMGMITALTITNPGTGYISTPTLTFATAPVGGTTATALGNASNFVLDGIMQTSAGSGYTTAPTATVTASTGAATLLPTVVSGINLLSNGFIGGNGDITVAGSIGGTAGFTKIGGDTVTLSAANTYSGGTTVNTGLLKILPTSPTTSALPAGAVSITGGILQLATNVTAGSQSSPTPASNVNITSLSITGTGQLDINNNHIIINYGAGADPIASIAAMIKSGFNGGAWTGAGIMSTAAQTNGGSYGIGYADSADPGNPAGLASGQIEIEYTLLGDANLDGAVNGSDFAILATNFNKAVNGWDAGDFNYDGAANGSDFALLASNFNKGASQAADLTALDSFAAANGLSASVPEPVSIGLMAMGAVGLLARRRRKS